MEHCSCPEHPFSLANLLELLPARRRSFDRMELLDWQTELQARQTALDRREQTLEARLRCGRIFRIPPDRILPPSAGPRRRFSDESLIALCDSIRRFGILYPLAVRPLYADGDKESTDFSAMQYSLLAGERRLRAALLLGLDTVPCLSFDAPDGDVIAVHLIGALRREDLSMFEYAGALFTLCDYCGLSQQKAAEALSVSPSFVANKLRLLKLTEPERDAIVEAGLCERHARALLRLPSLDGRKEALAEMIRGRMTVAAAEEYTDSLLSRHAVHCTEEAKPRRTKLILRDADLFFSAVERAAAACRESGIDIVSRREETDDEICWVLRIPKRTT